MDKKYFKGKIKVYSNYANCTMSGLIHNLYDYHGKISPIDIEESEQKMKQ